MEKLIINDIKRDILKQQSYRNQYLERHLIV